MAMMWAESENNEGRDSDAACIVGFGLIILQIVCKPTNTHSGDLDGLGSITSIHWREKCSNSSASSRFSTFSTFPNPELNLGSGSDLPAVQNLTAAILGQRQSQPICGHKMTTLRVQSEQESESSLTCTFKKFKTGFQK
ncbi:hypothetical protein B0H10DRAFT_1966077 [Mycena sp. CBHHK59/15]|nr:hypothetical protein B0H10DRAFT_1966077 [Mycena sp. CBHHK59/15]